MNKRNFILALFILLTPAILFFLVNTPQASSTTTYFKSNKTIHHWLTDNGANVYFVQAPGLPIVDINIMFRAGSAYDGDKPGLAAFVTSLLNKGAADLNADQIAEKFEDSGAIFAPHLDRDQISLTLRSLTEPSLLNPVTELLATLVANPSFPEDKIQNVKARTLVALQKNLEQVGAVAAQHFSRALYGNDPYAHPMLGTASSVETFSQSDLNNFHQNYMVAKNATVVLVGDLSTDQAEKMAKTLTHALASGTAAAALPDVPSITRPIDINIPFDSEQAHIFIGQPCAIANDPDLFPLLVGNYILGGNMLSSRLYLSVREERGLAYSVGSAFMQLARPAPFLMRAQTKNDQAEETVKIMQATLAEFVVQGPTEEELAEAKKGLSNSFPLSISNNAKMAHTVASIGFYQLPLDLLDTYQDQIESVTIEQIKSAFTRRIYPDKMALVIVGGKKP